MDGIKSYTSSHRKKYINLCVIRVTLGICRTTTNKTLQFPLLCPILWRNNYLLATCRSLERQAIVFLLLTVMGTHY